MNQCNCRISLSDIGYYECELEKGHKGNHKALDTSNCRKPIITWEPHLKKDLIITEKWLYAHTNLMTILDKIKIDLNYMDVVTNLNDKYNAVPTLYINFIEHIENRYPNELLMDSIMDKITERERLTVKMFYDYFDIDKEYSLDILINVDNTLE